MRISLTGPELPAPAAIPLSLHPQGPAPPNGDAFLDPQPLSAAPCCQGHPGTLGQIGRQTTRPDRGIVKSLHGRGRPPWRMKMVLSPGDVGATWCREPDQE